LKKDGLLKPTDYFDERAKSEFLQQCLEGSMVPEVTIFNTAWLIEKGFERILSKDGRSDGREGKRGDLPARSRFGEGRGRFSEQFVFQLGAALTLFYCLTLAFLFLLSA